MRLMVDFKWAWPSILLSVVCAVIASVVCIQIVGDNHVAAEIVGG